MLDALAVQMTIVARDIPMMVCNGNISVGAIHFGENPIFIYHYCVSTTILFDTVVILEYLLWKFGILKKELM